MNTQYEELLSRVMRQGTDKGDRTGTGTRSMFAQSLRYNLADGFPLITTKKVHMKSVVAELIWFLSGSTNVRELQAMGCSIWDEWADEDGDIGYAYGSQWRNFGGHEDWDRFMDKPMDHVGVDQITEVIEAIKTNPDSRRHLVSAWNPEFLEEVALPPCHFAFQFYVANGKLSCVVFQRSADLFLGVPFNIASYALLTHMVARQTGLEVGELVWHGTDCHIYSNHFKQVQEQLSREPYEFPTLVLAKRDGIFDYRPEDVQVMFYAHHPAIKAPVAI